MDLAMLLNFDYDGVIVDSFDQLLDLAMRAQLVLGRGRCPTAADLKTIENLAFEDLAKSIGLSKSDVKNYCDNIFKLQRKKWEPMVFPGIVDVINQIAERHIIVVVTSSQNEAVHANLKKIGLNKAVVEVMGGNLGMSKAERIRKAQKRFSVNAADTFMVGDAMSDIRQGKAAGVRTIAVTWGYQDKVLLEQEHPDFIIDNPADLIKIVG